MYYEIRTFKIWVAKQQTTCTDAHVHVAGRGVEVRSIEECRGADISVGCLGKYVSTDVCRDSATSLKG